MSDFLMLMNASALISDFRSLAKKEGMERETGLAIESPVL